MIREERLEGLGYLPRFVDSKVIFILAACGVIGALVGVFFAVNIPRVALKTYIGLMVLSIGVVILMPRSHKRTLSWKSLVGIGLLSSFNKERSGEGYGPLVTGGEIISGRETRSSVRSTRLEEAVGCIVGFFSYVLAKGSIFRMVATATSIGSVTAAPFVALTVRKVNPEKLRVVIGLVTIVLGALTLAKIFIF